MVFESVKKSLSLFSGYGFRGLWMLFFLVVFSSFLEILSIGMLIPFIGIISSPDKYANYGLSSKIFEFIGLPVEAITITDITLSFVITSLIASFSRVVLLRYQVLFTHRLAGSISARIFSNYIFSTYESYIKSNSSKYISGITTKVNHLVGHVIIPITELFASGIITISIIFALILVDPVICALLVFGLSIIYGVIGVFSRSRLERYGKETSACASEQISIIEKSIGGFRDIYLSGLQNAFLENYSKIDNRFRYSLAISSFYAASPRYLLEGLAMSLIAMVVYFYIQSSSDVVSIIPVLGAFAVGAQKLFPSAQRLYDGWSKLKSAGTIIDDIQSLINSKSISSQSMGSVLNENILFEKELVFNNAEYTYPNCNRPVWSGVNLTIPIGSFVGLIGQSGAGKSTFVDVLIGLLHLSKGSFCVDGKLIDNKTTLQWVSKIAHVPQDIYIVNGSLIDNIAFGVNYENIDYERLINVLDMVGLSDFVKSLDDGINSNLGDRGIMLSGGQKQRIGIARALYDKDKSILVLDEATSALDVESEDAIISNLHNLRCKYTIFMISHRASSFDNCDFNLEFNDGCVSKTFRNK